MDREEKGTIAFIILMILITSISITALICSDQKFKSETHSDDIRITEWISPDGVHYWYERSGYHASLAPRYDKNGNLVIDK